MIILAVGYLVASLKPPINGLVAQLGAQLLCKQKVAGSSPVSSTKGTAEVPSDFGKPPINRGVIQLVECVVWDHDAAGSSPVAPTKSVNMDFRFKLPPTA